MPFYPFSFREFFRFGGFGGFAAAAAAPAAATFTATIPAAAPLAPIPSRQAAGDADQSSSSDDDDESHEEPVVEDNVSKAAAAAFAGAKAAKMHPGRIGAAPNGLGPRTDGQSTVWSAAVYADTTRQTGYTWDTFRLGWNAPLNKVFHPLDDDICTWTCCGGKWDSVGCQASPTTIAPAPPAPKAAPKKKRVVTGATNATTLSCVACSSRCSQWTGHPERAITFLFFTLFLSLFLPCGTAHLVFFLQDARIDARRSRPSRDSPHRAVVGAFTCHL